MKVLIFMLGSILMLSAAAQQNSLDLFNEQEKTENLKKRFESDKAALKMQKRMELADNIASKGLIVFCNRDESQLSDPLIGTAFYKGKSYLVSPRQDNGYAANWGSGPEGRYYIHFESGTKTYVIRPNRNQIYQDLKWRESEIYIKEKIEIGTETYGKKQVRSKSYCRFVNESRAEID